MHYANCNTFNADFDGDEINLHMPQDNLGRAEGYGIVHADQQYIVPTDGKPIRGLIQDHIVAGTLLTKRDTFLSRGDFMQLVYAACTPARPGMKDPCNLPCPLPALLKPEPLYTGKQVVSAVVGFFTRDMPPLTLSAGSKVPIDYWGEHSGETSVLFHKGELLTGCMDKAQYGMYGLVHAVQELYGCNVAGRLLSGLSRLFTTFCQHHGFTCGLDDVVLVPAAEQERAAILARAEARAMTASADFAGIGADEEALQEYSQAVPSCLQAQGALPTLLSVSCLTASVLTSSASCLQACLPGGMAKPFPHNCMSLMTVSGAKGSIVNFSQISCLLGQQELEGRRTPRMASGKTLPCFGPFDAGARAGGFIGDRFLSGLRPQEYYFHCMAGRDGLVDTTVKTSRSGYLQRCLVKNLESLRVHYDSTVRDDADGSVVQFQYGEDGIDVMQVGFLRKFGFLSQNVARFAQQLDVGRKFGDDLRQYLESNPDHTLSTAESGMLQAGQRCMKPLVGAVRQCRGKLNQFVEQRRGRRLMELKYMSSLANPGEAVGVIAAQSVGEPSTQMTLNTFHMAGEPLL
eukprot:jgi/Astpho2/2926/e_gw1.00050.63.1_t